MSEYDPITNPEARRGRIDELFSAATDLPVEARAQFLSAECGGDLELQREVESLLAYDSVTRNAIAGLVQDAAQSIVQRDLPAGTLIGPYRVVKELGRGGMGVVYLAERNDDVYRKQVAIKLVKRGMDSDAVLVRFRHERQILATLDHPYIAKLLDGGSLPDGRPYFVMEYVEGRRITDHCRELGLTVAERCQLFRKVCDAISYAHRNLVVHRDLKPGNILAGADGSPKLLDFGIARVLSPEPDSGSTGLTAPQLRPLTPDYASPEQLHGGPVTTSADIYSLGVVFYELLAGCRPYAIDSNQAGRAEMFAALPAPAPPSTLAPVHPDLDNIALMALRPEPERRYASVDAFSEDIRRHFDGLPVSARGDGFRYRAGKFVRRHRLGMAAAAITFAGLATGLVVATREARIASAQRNRAERRLGQLVDLANRTLFDIHSELERLPGATEARRNIVKTTLDYLNSLSKDAGDDPAFVAALGSAYLRIGDVQGLPDAANIGDVQGALASYKRGLELYRHLKNSDARIVITRVDLQRHLALVQNELKPGPEALAAAAEAVRLGEEARKTFPRDEEVTETLGDTYLSLSRLQRYSNPKEATANARHAIAILAPPAQAHPDNRPNQMNISSAYSALGSALTNTGGDAAGALAAFRKGSEIDQSLAARYPGDPVIRRNLMLSYANVGDTLGDNLHYNMGDPKGASEYYRKVVGIAESIAAADPRNLAARYDLAQALMRCGYSLRAPEDKGEALDLLGRAVKAASEAHQGDPSNAEYTYLAGQTHQRLGIRLTLTGDDAQALTELRGALAVFTQILTANPNTDSAYHAVIITRNAIANAMARGGDRAALSMITQSAAEATRFAARAGGTAQGQIYIPRSSRWIAEIYVVLAKHGGARDDWEKARSYFSEALSVLDHMAQQPGAGDLSADIKPIQTRLSEVENHLAGLK